MSNLSSNDTASDTWPAIALVMVGHCWERDRGRPGARIFITGRFVMTIAEARKIDTRCRECISVSTLELGEDGTVGWLIGHEDNCSWLLDLLNRNADVLARFGGGGVSAFFYGDPVFRDTRVAWYNGKRGDAESYSKIACQAGRRELVPYGADLTGDTWIAKGTVPHPEYGAFQNTGVLCTRTARRIVVDVDDEPMWLASGDPLDRCIRENFKPAGIRNLPGGGRKVHYDLIVPDDAAAEGWPADTKGRNGADWLSNSFTMITGLHWTGSRYEPTGAGQIIVSVGLMKLMIVTLGIQGDHADACSDDFDADAEEWIEPDGAYPSQYAEGVLGNWVVGTRDNSLLKRCGIIKAAGQHGTRGMRTLLLDLAAEYDAETGRGTAAVYRAYERCFQADAKANDIRRDNDMLPAEWAEAAEERIARGAQQAVVNGTLVQSPGLQPPAPETPPDGVPPELAAIAALYNPVDWDEACKDQPEGVDWLFDPVLEKGTVNALFAQPGTGKSLLAEEISWTLVQDGHVVVYVDDENRVADLVERLTDMGATPADLANLRMYSFAGLPPLDTPAGGIHLLALAVVNRAELVVLDTTTRMVAGHENDSDTFLQLYRCSLVQLKQRGITVLRLDHPGKDEERGQRGSSAKDGDVDTIWKLTEVIKETAFRLERTKSRSGHGESSAMIRRWKNPLRHEWESAGLSAAADLARRLGEAGIPPDAGRPAVREALAKLGLKASNSLLTQAIRLRKNCPETPRTAADSSDSSASESDCPSVPHIGTDRRTALDPDRPVNADLTPTQLAQIRQVTGGDEALTDEERELLRVRKERES